VITHAAGHDRHVPEIPLVRVHPATAGKTLGIRSFGPGVGHAFAGQGWNRRVQAHVGGDFQTPHPAHGRRRQQPSLRRAHRQRHVGADRGAPGVAGVGIQPRGDVHGQHPRPGGVDGAEQGPPRLGKRAVQPDPEQTVDDPIGLASEGSRDRLALRRRIGDVDGFHRESGEVREGGADIVAVVTLAREEQQAIAGPGMASQGRGQDHADTRDDVRLAGSRGPRGRLPGPHAGDG